MEKITLDAQSLIVSLFLAKKSAFIYMTELYDFANFIKEFAKKAPCLSSEEELQIETHLPYYEIEKFCKLYDEIFYPVDNKIFLRKEIPNYLVAGLNTNKIVARGILIYSTENKIKSRKEQISSLRARTGLTPKEYCIVENCGECGNFHSDTTDYEWCEKNCQSFIAQRDKKGEK
jgi:hypothetical protein